MRHNIWPCTPQFPAGFGLQASGCKHQLVLRFIGFRNMHSFSPHVDTCPTVIYPRIVTYARRDMGPPKQKLPLVFESCFLREREQERCGSLGRRLTPAGNRNAARVSADD